MHLLAYNLIRLLMAQAASTTELVPREISFKYRVQLWTHWQSHCFGNLAVQMFRYCAPSSPKERWASGPGDENREPANELAPRFTIGAITRSWSSASPVPCATARYSDLPESFKQLQTRLLKRTGGDREMADILALVLLHDERLVEQAIAQALASGEPSKEHVINCLNRLEQPQRPQPLKPPPALRLMTEPQANTARYDDLRRWHHES